MGKVLVFAGIILPLFGLWEILKIGPTGGRFDFSFAALVLCVVNTLYLRESLKPSIFFSKEVGEDFKLTAYEIPIYDLVLRKIFIASFKKETSYDFYVEKATDLSSEQVASIKENASLYAEMFSLNKNTLLMILSQYLSAEKIKRDSGMMATKALIEKSFPKFLSKEPVEFYELLKEK